MPSTPSAPWKSAVPAHRTVSSTNVPGAWRIATKSAAAKTAPGAHRQSIAGSVRSASVSHAIGVALIVPMVATLSTQPAPAKNPAVTG